MDVAEWIRGGRWDEALRASAAAVQRAGRGGADARQAAALQRAAVLRAYAEGDDGARSLAERRDRLSEARRVLAAEMRGAAALVAAYVDVGLAQLRVADGDAAAARRALALEFAAELLPAVPAAGRAPLLACWPRLAAAAPPDAALAVAAAARAAGWTRPRPPAFDAWLASYARSCLDARAHTLDERSPTHAHADPPPGAPELDAPTALALRLAYAEALDRLLLAAAVPPAQVASTCRALLAACEELRAEWPDRWAAVAAAPDGLGPFHGGAGRGLSAAGAAAAAEDVRRLLDALARRVWRHLARAHDERARELAAVRRPAPELSAARRRALCSMVDCVARALGDPAAAAAALREAKPMPSAGGDLPPAWLQLLAASTCDVLAVLAAHADFWHLDAALGDAYDAALDAASRGLGALLAAAARQPPLMALLLPLLPPPLAAGLPALQRAVAYARADAGLPPAPAAALAAARLLAAPRPDAARLAAALLAAPEPIAEAAEAAALLPAFPAVNAAVATRLPWFVGRVQSADDGGVLDALDRRYEEWQEALPALRLRSRCNNESNEDGDGDGTWTRQLDASARTLRRLRASVS